MTYHFPSGRVKDDRPSYSEKSRQRIRLHIHRGLKYYKVRYLILNSDMSYRHLSFLQFFFLSEMALSLSEFKVKYYSEYNIVELMKPSAYNSLYQYLLHSRDKSLYGTFVSLLNPYTLQSFTKHLNFYFFFKKKKRF